MSQVLSPWGYLPDGWKLSTIDEEKTALFDYVANGSFASLAENVKYRETPDYAVLIRLVDYNNNFSGDFVYIDEHAYNFLSKSKLYGDEIIISNVGANVGTVFKAPRLNKKMSLAPNAICVKFKGCNDFYYYWLRSRIGQHIINSLVSGSAQPKFNKTHFRSMPIPVPPIEIQENIASILSSLDDKIAVNRRICENLEAQAQALFKHWFIDFAPFKNGKFVESELGMIPEGWRVGGLFDIAEVHDSKRKPLSGMQRAKMKKVYPYYGATEQMDMVDDYIFDGRYVLMGEDGSVVRENGLPYIQYVWGKIWVNNHAHVLTGKNGFTTEMLIPFLTTYNIKGLVTGAVQAKLNQANMAKISLAIPPMSILENISGLLETMYDTYRNCCTEMVNLSTLRDTLLPKLMSGQIKV